MSKIIITYKTALYAHNEASKMQGYNPERTRLNNLINLYNSKKPKSLLDGKPEMDYVVLNEVDLKAKRSGADEA